MGVLDWFRKAMCNTARPSVESVGRVDADADAAMKHTKHRGMERKKRGLIHAIVEMQERNEDTREMLPSRDSMCNNNKYNTNKQQQINSIQKEENNSPPKKKRTNFFPGKHFVRQAQDVLLVG